MRFARPEMLQLLWLVAGLALLVVLSAARRRKMLSRLADPDLLAALAPRRSPARRALREGMLLAALALLVLASATPQWGLVEEEVRQVGVDVVIAVDTSLSMLAEDVRPSRLERARLELGELLEAIRGDRVALVVFSSSAHAVVPLTLDVGVVEMFLDVLDTEITSGHGTAVAQAIERSIEVFPEDDEGHRVLVLVTDGEDHGGGAIEAARHAAEAGVVIHTVGIGTEQGEPIPIRDPFRGERIWKTDEEGRIVTTRLDEESLRRIAGATGGTYRRVGPGGQSLARLYDEIQKMEERAVQDRMARRMRDRFQWPLSAGIFLLLVRVALPEGRRKRRETTRRS